MEILKTKSNYKRRRLKNRRRYKKIKSGIQAELVKGEIVKIFAAIGLESTVVDPNEIRLIRKDTDSPILMVFKDVKVKMDVLKLAKKLKGSEWRDQSYCEHQK